MSKTLQEKIGSVLDRRNPDGLLTQESFALDEADDVVKYVRLSMEEVDAKYTNRSLEAGERVNDLLSRVLGNVSFKYQGSVISNTHIKGASDIDLLVVAEKFFGWDRQDVERSLEMPEKLKYSGVELGRLENALNTQPYTGNPIEDLRSIRVKCEHSLKAAYDECDTTKSKSIRILNKHLNREVDVVVASWFDNAVSFASDKTISCRGIRIYNHEKHVRENVDYPFRRVEMIDRRDESTEGRLKMMIRLLKTLKAEADNEIDFSSFDIYSLCYAMPVEFYAAANQYQMIFKLANFFYNTVKDPSSRNRLTSVDGREAIFTTSEKVLAANQLYAELYDLYVQLRDRGLV